MMNLKHRSCLARVLWGPRNNLINYIDRLTKKLDNGLHTDDRWAINVGVEGAVLNNTHEREIHRDVGRTINHSLGFIDVYETS